MSALITPQQALGVATQRPWKRQAVPRQDYPVPGVRGPRGAGDHTRRAPVVPGSPGRPADPRRDRRASRARCHEQHGPEVRADPAAGVRVRHAAVAPGHLADGACGEPGAGGRPLEGSPRPAAARAPSVPRGPKRSRSRLPHCAGVHRAPEVRDRPGLLELVRSGRSARARPDRQARVQRAPDVASRPRRAPGDGARRGLSPPA
jgi:hypothetical protein